MQAHPLKGDGSLTTRVPVLQSGAGTGLPVSHALRVVQRVLYYCRVTTLLALPAKLEPALFRLNSCLGESPLPFVQRAMLPVSCNPGPWGPRSAQYWHYALLSIAREYRGQ